MVNHEDPPLYSDSHSLVNIDNLPSDFHSYFDDNLSVLNINMRSLKSNFTLLTGFLYQLKCPVKVIVVTESFLDDSSSGLYNIPGFKKVQVNRPSHGGGIVAYIHHTIDYNIESKYTGIYPTHESLFAKLRLPDNTDVNLFCVYIPPDRDLIQFVDFLNTLPHRLLKKNLIIAGGMNVCISRDSGTTAYKSYNDFFVTKGFRQLIKFPTYISYNSNASVLDHIWTNLEVATSSFGFSAPISDHIPAIVCFSVVATVPDKDLYFRDFSVTNKQRFIDDMEHNFSKLNDCLFDDQLSLNDSFIFLSEWLIAICNFYFPLKKKRVSGRRFRSPWITSSIIKLIKKKHKLFKMFKQHEITYRSYSDYCTLLKELLALAEASYHRRRFDSCKTDSKQKWKHINDLLGKCGTETITKLEINGVTTSEPLALGNHCISYYSNVASNIQTNLDSPDDDFGLDLGTNEHDPLTEFTPITVSQIIIIVV